MKKYLSCWVFYKNGTSRHNPLTLTETRLISQIAQDPDVEKIEVHLETCTSYKYKLIFNI